MEGECNTSVHGLPIARGLHCRYRCRDPEPAGTGQPREFNCSVDDTLSPSITIVTVAVMMMMMVLMSYSDLFVSPNLQGLEICSLWCLEVPKSIGRIFLNSLCRLSLENASLTPVSPAPGETMRSSPYWRNLLTHCAMRIGWTQRGLAPKYL